MSRLKTKGKRIVLLQIAASRKRRVNLLRFTDSGVVCSFALHLVVTVVNLRELQAGVEDRAEATRGVDLLQETLILRRGGPRAFTLTQTQAEPEEPLFGHLLLPGDLHG